MQTREINVKAKEPVLKRLMGSPFRAALFGFFDHSSRHALTQVDRFSNSELNRWEGMFHEEIILRKFIAIAFERLDGFPNPKTLLDALKQSKTPNQKVRALINFILPSLRHCLNTMSKDDKNNPLHPVFILFSLDYQTFFTPGIARKLAAIDPNAVCRRLIEFSNQLNQPVEEKNDGINALDRMHILVKKVEPIIANYLKNLKIRNYGDPLPVFILLQLDYERLFKKEIAEKLHAIANDMTAYISTLLYDTPLRQMIALPIKKLLEAGADVNYGGSKRMTILMMACSSRQQQVAELILAYEPNIHITTAVQGHSAIYYAVIFNMPDILAKLLKFEPSMYQCRKALQVSVRSNAIKCLQLLINYLGVPLSKLSLEGPHERTLLDTAMRLCHFEVVRLLLEAGLETRDTPNFKIPAQFFDALQRQPNKELTNRICKFFPLQKAYPKAAITKAPASERKDDDPKIRRKNF